MVVDPLIEYSGTHPQFSLVMDHQIFVQQRIGRRLVLIAMEPDRHLSDPIGAQGSPWQALLGCHPQSHLARSQECIGLINDKVGTEIVIALVSQERGDPLPFGLQLDDIEQIPFAQQRLGLMRLDDRIGLPTETYVPDGIQRIGMVHGHPIAHLRLPGIFGMRNRIERGDSIEIAIFAQQVLSDGHTHLRIDRTEQYGFGCQLMEDPLAHLSLLMDKGIVDPQSPREGNPHTGTAQQGIIGRIGQGGLHLFQGGLSGFGRIDLLQDDLLNTGIEHFALRQMAGRGTRDQSPPGQEDSYPTTG